MAEEKTPIKVKKIGHVVFNVSDIERSTKFWTEIMGFKVSDRNERGPVVRMGKTTRHARGLASAS
jgi:catechol 2,3-dioxygenase-like lactoylglutathione lyase family enzyme